MKKFITDEEYKELIESLKDFGKIQSVGQSVSDGITLLAGKEPSLVIYFEELYKDINEQEIFKKYKDFPIFCKVIGKMVP